MQRLIGGAIHEATGEIPAPPSAQEKVESPEWKDKNNNEILDYEELTWRVKELNWKIPASRLRF